jgi:hypothetical protein
VVLESDKERSLEMPESRMLRIIFKSKLNEVTGQGKIFNIIKIHDLFSYLVLLGW